MSKKTKYKYQEQVEEAVARLRTGEALEVSGLDLDQARYFITMIQEKMQRSTGFLVWEVTNNNPEAEVKISLIWRIRNMFTYRGRIYYQYRHDSFNALELATADLPTRHWVWTRKFDEQDKQPVNLIDLLRIKEHICWQVFKYEEGLKTLLGK